VCLAVGMYHLTGVYVGREHDIHSGNLSCDTDVFVGSECDIHRYSQSNYLRRI